MTRKQVAINLVIRSVMGLATGILAAHDALTPINRRTAAFVRRTLRVSRQEA